MSNINIIKLNENEIIYDGKRYENVENPKMYIDLNIYNDKSEVTTGRKTSYNIYEGTTYELLGYCHSLSFSMDVVRSKMAQHIKKGKSYEIYIKKVNEKETKLYLYEYNNGWIYNGYSLVTKFKVVEIPKVEIKINRDL